MAIQTITAQETARHPVNRLPIMVSMLSPTLAFS